MAFHQVHFPDLHSSTEGNAGRKSIQASKGPGSILRFGPAQGEVRMKCPGLPLKAMIRKSPLQVLFETSECGGGLHPYPEDPGPTDRGEGTEASNLHGEGPRATGHLLDDTLDDGNASGPDLTQELQRKVEEIRPDPSDRVVRLPERPGGPIDPLPFLLGNVYGDEESHEPLRQETCTWGLDVMASTPFSACSTSRVLEAQPREKRTAPSSWVPKILCTSGAQLSP